MTATWSLQKFLAGAKYNVDDIIGDAGQDLPESDEEIDEESIRTATATSMTKAFTDKRFKTGREREPGKSDKVAATGGSGIHLT